MDELNFKKKKEYLKSLINNSLLKVDISPGEKENLENLLKVLDTYLYDNRIIRKGALTHLAIDSIYLDFSFIEEFVKFDQSL